MLELFFGVHWSSDGIGLRLRFSCCRILSDLRGLRKPAHGREIKVRTSSYVQRTTILVELPVQSRICRELLPPEKRDRKAIAGHSWSCHEKLVAVPLLRCCDCCSSLHINIRFGGYLLSCFRLWADKQVQRLSC